MSCGVFYGLRLGLAYANFFRLGSDFVAIGDLAKCDLRTWIRSDVIHFCSVRNETISCWMVSFGGRLVMIKLDPWGAVHVKSTRSD